MFMKIIEWYIGVNTNFSVSFGKAGKFMKNYVTDDEYDKILKTYPDFKPENIWSSLFEMAGTFGKFAMHIAKKLNFT